MGLGFGVCGGFGGAGVISPPFSNRGRRLTADFRIKGRRLPLGFCGVVGVSVCVVSCSCIGVLAVVTVRSVRCRVRVP